MIPHALVSALFPDASARLRGNEQPFSIMIDGEAGEVVYRHAHNQTAAYGLVKRARKEGRTGMRIRVNQT